MNKENKRFFLSGDIKKRIRLLKLPDTQVQFLTKGQLLKIKNSQPKCPICDLIEKTFNRKNDTTTYKIKRNI